MSFKIFIYGIERSQLYRTIRIKLDKYVNIFIIPSDLTEKIFGKIINKNILHKNICHSLNA